jgi:hypothetical protein
MVCAIWDCCSLPLPGLRSALMGITFIRSLYPGGCFVRFVGTQSSLSRWKQTHCHRGYHPLPAKEWLSVDCSERRCRNLYDGGGERGSTTRNDGGLAAQAKYIGIKLYPRGTGCPIPGRRSAMAGMGNHRVGLVHFRPPLGAGAVGVGGMASGR